jgi:hypothetical protein
VNAPNSAPASGAAPRRERSHERRAGADRHNLTAHRPSCGSIKTAIPSSRPARTGAGARSGGPGCPKGIAVGGAQRPGRPRARRHPQRTDGRRHRDANRSSDPAHASVTSPPHAPPNHPRPTKSAPDMRAFSPPLTRSPGRTRRPCSGQPELLFRHSGPTDEGTVPGRALEPGQRMRATRLRAGPLHGALSPAWPRPLDERGVG